MSRAGARETTARRLKESALDVFRWLPPVVRRQLTHAITPTYCVGAVAVCLDPAGRVLLVRSRHHRAWSLPGGLLKRGETPSAAIVRELGEELGAAVAEAALGDRPRVVVDPAMRQVTVVYRLTLDREPVGDGIEVVEVGWFSLAALPSALLRGTRESLRLCDVLDR